MKYEGREKIVCVVFDPRRTYHTQNNMFPYFLPYGIHTGVFVLQLSTLQSLPLSVSYIRVWGSELSIPCLRFIPSSLRKLSVSF
jgi:hypothetical protein